MVTNARHAPTTQEGWTEVDEYLAARLLPSDAILDDVVRGSMEAGLPQIQVSPVLGRFLNLLARLQGATRILEIGTLAGYSTIWLARALPPGGRLITLEANPVHAEIARANLRRAGFERTVEVRLGLALDSLPALAADGEEPFDLVFIDADKENNPEYVAWALRLSRPGTVIVVDNVVRNGAVLDETTTDPNLLGIRRMLELVAGEPRLEGTALQTVGVKGYDGFAVLRVTG
jgi:predicted O-methyltransferase YrrM